MRLCEQHLAHLGSQIRQPKYQRSKVEPGVVHLGTGAFHRAHQAVYFDDLLSAEPQWGIVGASLHSTDTASALNPQDGLYALIEKSAAESYRIIGSVQSVIPVAEDPAALLAIMTDPRLRIVTLTITEKGYCHIPATGELDIGNPDIVADLVALRKQRFPVSAIGWLVFALQERMRQGSVPLSLLSCDNLPSNGKVLRNVVTSLAEQFDSESARWISEQCSFPCSMVDRIVPATSDTDKATLMDNAGFTDAWPVVAEPFTQWVVEDSFCSGRPDFASVGIELVADVAPFEEMKLRMLNGCHSCIAYLGYLAGHSTVAEGMQADGFRDYLGAMMTQEIMPSLSLPPDTDLAAYRDALLMRFENPALQHRTAQIAMDGSQKVPPRLLATIQDNLADNRPVDKLCLGVAAWIRYASGIDERGANIEVSDPIAQQTCAIGERCREVAADLLQEFLALDSVFPLSLVRNADFRNAVQKALVILYADGAAKSVAVIARV